MNGQVLHYRIDGSNGPSIVLLHPVGLDLTFLDGLASALARRYRVLRVDAAGHGRSPAPRHRGYTLADYADDVSATMTSTGSSPAIVIGFSFGGMQAQTLAIAHASDVRAAVVGVCPSTLSDEGRRVANERADTSERDGMAGQVDATIARWFTPAFSETAGVEPVRRRLLADDPKGWADAWRAIARLHTQPDLPSIRTPVLCLAGEADAASPPAVLRQMASLIPGAQFACVAGAPHMAFIEQPDATLEAIATFLSRVG